MRRLLSGFLVLAAFATAAGSASAHVTVVFPNCGEVIAGGSQATVLWNVLITHGAGQTVIDFSSNGGVSWSNLFTGGFAGGLGQFSQVVTMPNLCTPTNCFIRVTYTYVGGSQTDTSDCPFTVTETNEVTPLGGSVGGSLSFHHEYPCAPGLLGVTFLSFTGDSSSLPLPGGVSLSLNLDALTFVLLGVPAVSVATLDSSGFGDTVPFPIPNNPLLSGLDMWVAGASFHLADGQFHDGSATVNFQLQ